MLCLQEEWPLRGLTIESDDAERRQLQLHLHIRRRVDSRIGRLTHERQRSTEQCTCREPEQYEQLRSWGNGILRQLRLAHDADVHRCPLDTRRTLEQRHHRGELLADRVCDCLCPSWIGVLNLYIDQHRVDRRSRR